jgi:hypothetical protein
MGGQQGLMWQLASEPGSVSEEAGTGERREDKKNRGGSAPQAWKPLFYLAGRARLSQRTI